MYGGQSTYIPLKVNQAGVIPIIFASSVLYLPVIATNILPVDANHDHDWGNSVQRWVNNNLVNGRGLWYMVIYGALIIGFTYFYTLITFDPHQQADTIRKQGGFIPGHPARTADRALPGQDRVPHHASRRAVHHGHRTAPGDHARRSPTSRTSRSRAPRSSSRSASPSRR